MPENIYQNFSVASSVCVEMKISCLLLFESLRGNVSLEGKVYIEGVESVEIWLSLGRAINSGMQYSLGNTNSPLHYIYFRIFQFGKL